MTGFLRGVGILVMASVMCGAQALPSVTPKPSAGQAAATQVPSSPKAAAGGSPAATQTPATQSPAAPRAPINLGPLPSVDEIEGPMMRVPAAPGAANGTTSTPITTTKTADDVFLFKKKVEEVVVHATVVDEKHRPLTNLTKSAFQVWEDGAPQTISSFRHEDIPVALGLLVDNSGSMRSKRESVSKAALNLVLSSNRQDEVFVVNFNVDAFLDAPLTNSIPKLKEALENVDARDSTALYDAIVASLAELKRSKLDKKVLMVVTDGEDNSSRKSLEQTIRAVQAEDGPVIYAIGLLDQGREGKRAKRALNALADNTGGVAYFPVDLRDVDSISQSVAKDIRNQYTLGYKPTHPQSEGGYRSLRVEAKAEGVKNPTVRTRSGYFAGENMQAPQNQAAQPAPDASASPVVAKP